MWVQVTYPAQEPAPVVARAHPHGGSHALHIRLLGDPAHLPDLEGRAAHWTVGGAGWSNGLLRFWLYLMPGFAFRGLAGFGYARDHRQPLDAGAWLVDQLAPCPPRAGARSGG
jgi:hypothetical protein